LVSIHKFGNEYNVPIIAKRFNFRPLHADLTNPLMKQSGATGLHAPLETLELPCFQAFVAEVVVMSLDPSPHFRCIPVRFDHTAR